MGGRGDNGQVTLSFMYEAMLPCRWTLSNSHRQNVVKAKSDEHWRHGDNFGDRVKVQLGMFGDFMPSTVATRMALAGPGHTS